MFSNFTENYFFSPLFRMEQEFLLANFYPLFKYLKNSKKKIIIYGCSFLAELFFKRFEVEKLNIIAFSDSDEGKWQKTFLRKPIIAPENINSSGASVVIITSFYYQREINAYLVSILDKNIAVVPALKFDYFSFLNHKTLWKDVLPLWKKDVKQFVKLFKEKSKILCLIEGFELEPFFIYLLNCLTSQRKNKLLILRSPKELKVGLEERGFKVENMEKKFEDFMKVYFRGNRLIEAEGKAIESLKESDFFKNLKISGSSDLLWKTFFYDRLIFRVLDNVGGVKFAEKTLNDFRASAVLYFGPLRSSLFITFLNAAIQHKRPTILFPYLVEDNVIMKSLIDELSTAVGLPRPEEPERRKLQTKKNLFYHRILPKFIFRVVTENMGKARLKSKIYSSPIFLIIFSLKYRFEIRELLKTLIHIKEKLTLKGTIIIKCSDKTNNFNRDVVSEVDFCRDYLREILDKKKGIVLIDKELTLSECLLKADAVFSAEKISMTTIDIKYSKKVVVDEYLYLKPEFITNLLKKRFHV